MRQSKETLSRRITVFFALALILIIIVSTIAFGIYFYPKYPTIIEDCAAKFDVDKRLIMSIIKVESGYDSHAVSSRGAVGLMQLMPNTAEDMRDKLDYDVNYSLASPRDNIYLGVGYLAYLIAKFDNVDYAIVAYNAGEGNLKQWLARSNDDKLEIPFPETRQYLSKVKRAYRAYNVLKLDDSHFL